VTSDCCGTFSASVWPDTRVMQPAVYTDATYSTRTGAGRYTSLFTPTRSGSYVVSVQKLSQPGLHMQIFCSVAELQLPCQDTPAALPLLSNDVLETADAQQAAAALMGIKAVWRGFLVFKVTETLTFTAASNGSISLRIDDKVCVAFFSSQRFRHDLRAFQRFTRCCRF
jgi:hypothetical protein